MPAIGSAAVARPKQPAHRRHPQDENRGGRQLRLPVDLQPHGQRGQQARRSARHGRRRHRLVGWTRTSRTGTAGRTDDADDLVDQPLRDRHGAGNPSAAEVAEAGGLKMS